ncbi:hypothetical protein BX265_0125 [Streptomyces sp. TLI_235]|nr:hypothetical protein [Streptomyces sp. TLI_235]PBC75468.1 hypothetical protein BX265_0125 [Streptomyces sp. TLI_235]
MFGWIFFGALLMAPIAFGMTREVRTARRAGASERMLRTLASRPGWRVMKPGEPWREYVPHYPWLDVPRSTTATGPGGDGREVTVARFIRLEQRRGLHWLVFHYELPGRVPTIRLERTWSAEALRVEVLAPGLYIPMAGDGRTPVLRDLVIATDLIDRLEALGAPAVSVQRESVCFVYHPLPDRAEVGRYVDGLAALLPDLVRIAVATEAAPIANESQDSRGE